MADLQETILPLADSNAESPYGREAAGLMQESVCLSMIMKHAQPKHMMHLQHINLNTIRGGRMQHTCMCQIAVRSQPISSTTLCTCICKSGHFHNQGWLSNCDPVPLSASVLLMPWEGLLEVPTSALHV